MAEVQAVKDLDKVKLISHLLERRYSKQMADVWNIGLNLALRISDLLSVKFNDIHDDRLLIKEINIALGTHSMRKTRGYHLYQSTKDIARVMKMLRHSSEGVTLRYIGVTQDDVDKDFVDLEI